VNTHKKPILCCPDLIREHAAECPRKHPVENIDSATIARFQNLFSKISYRDWGIELLQHRGSAIVQVHARVAHVSSADIFDNYGPPYTLCPEMDDDFLIDFIFEAIKEMEIHEIAEYFFFEGHKIYCPHNSLGKPLPEVESMRYRAQRKL